MRIADLGRQKQGFQTRPGLGVKQNFLRCADGETRLAATSY